MKKLLVCLLSIFLLADAYNNNAQAQIQLRIDSLINFPDTAIVGQAYPIAVRVMNMGNTPYQGPLQIGLMRDSLFTFLYFNSNPSVVILPNDTLTLFTSGTGTQGFVFDSTVFRAGNNVVVVWPYSNQSIVIDSFTTNVYVEFTTGVRSKYLDNNLLLYPNPFNDEIRFAGLNLNDIGRVRIFNIQGIIILDRKYDGNPIKSEWMEAGYYLIEWENRAGLRFYQRMVKQ